MASHTQKIQPPLPVRQGHKVVECELCPKLVASRCQIVNGYGPRNARYAIIAEAPGETEDIKGRPLIGPAGQTLRNWLMKVGINPERDVYYDNAVRCHPDGNKTPTSKEIRNCNEHLWAALEYIQPDIILAAGNTACEALLPPHIAAEGITKLRGHVFWNERLQRKIIPIFHPSAAFHDFGLEIFAFADLKKAVAEAKNPTKMPKGLGKYKALLTVEDVERECERMIGSDVLCFDTETTHQADLTCEEAGDAGGLNWRTAQVLCVGLTDEVGKAWIVPIMGQNFRKIWSPAEMRRVKAALNRLLGDEDGPALVAQNGKFDVHQLREMGIKTRSLAFDTMLAHSFIHESASHALEPMRSMFTTMPYYDSEVAETTDGKSHMEWAKEEDIWEYCCADVDCTLRIAKVLDELLDKEGEAVRWVFENISMPLQEIMTKVEKRGVLIDMELAGQIIEETDKLIDVTEHELYEAIPLKFRAADYNEWQQGKLHNSWQKKQKLLYVDLKLPLPPVLTDSGSNCKACRDRRTQHYWHTSTNKEAIKELEGAHPVIAPLKTVIQLTTLKKTFLLGEQDPDEVNHEDEDSNLAERTNQTKQKKRKRSGLLQHVGPDGRIHTSYRVGAVETGRMSCVSLDSEILTPTGWKLKDNLSVGDLVLGYDVQHDRVEWTPVKAIHSGRGRLGTFRYRPSDTLDWKKQHFLRCTANHRWVGETWSSGFAAAPHLRGFVEAENLPKDRTRVLFASGKLAPDGVLDLDPILAGIIGWAITDGHVINSNRQHHRPSLAIRLNKPRSVAAVRTLLETTPHSENPINQRVGHRNPPVEFYIGTDAWANTCAVAGIDSNDPKGAAVALVMRLSNSAREAMREAMMEADGSRTRGADRFGALDGPVAEAFGLLSVLRGDMVVNSRRILESGKPFIESSIRGRPYSARIKWIEEAEDSEVWCPETGTGTWFMRQGDAIVLTGNSSPNLQNLPHETDDRPAVYSLIRKLFMAPKGRKLVEIDYSQLELRVLAYMANEAVMIDKFEHNADYHLFTARTLLWPDLDTEMADKDWKVVHKDRRTSAKTVNFGIPYGLTAFGLAQRMGCSEEEATGIINGVMSFLTNVRDYFRKSDRDMKYRGTRKNAIGRTRHFHGVQSMTHFGGYKRMMGHMKREAYNYPIQSTGADILSLATIAVDRDPWFEENDCFMVLSVHDSITMETPADKAEECARRVLAYFEAAARDAIGLDGEPLDWYCPGEAKCADRWSDVDWTLEPNESREYVLKAA